MYSQNLKKIREKLGISLSKFARQLEMSQSTLTQYEHGTRTPSWQLFVQLNKKANVNLNWFATGEGEMFISNEIKIIPNNFEDEITKIVKRVLREEKESNPVR